MKNKLFLCSLALAGVQAMSGLSAQNNWTQSMRCGQMQYEQYLRSQDPNFDAKRQQMEQAIHTAIASTKNLPTTQSLFTIPVVVHIMYNTAAQNLTDAQVINAIDLLNKDYRRQNADAANTPSVWQPIAADMEIQFSLATLDPNGNPTTGIVHKSTTVSSFTTNDNVKSSAQGGDDPWDVNKYFNIWICNLGSSLLGYSAFPPVTTTFGTVIHYCTVPGTGSCAPFNLNRTMTHEIAHCFTLRHIWGDDGSACTGDDYCNDTPNQGGSSFGCSVFPVTDACSSSAPGIMFMNYLDYSDDACVNMFTQDQKTRAQSAITTYLTSLVNPSGLSVNVGASVTICAGSVTTLSANAAGGTVPYTYQWIPTNDLSCTNCTTPVANPTVTTTYTVLVTDAASNTATDVATITVINSLFVSVSATNVSCYGNTNGSATAIASCGTAPYNYVWSPSGQTTQTASGLSAGTHTVVVTDANSATATPIVTISQPPPFVSTLPLIQICFGYCDSINTGLSGGTPPYNYQWSTGATTAAITICPTVSTSYSFSVTDANGCTAADVIPVSVNPTPTITISGSSVSCGTTTLCASGGTNYLWYPGGQTSACIAVNSTTSTQYSVGSTDANGCYGSATTQSGGPTVGVQTNSSAGTASAVASGGIQPYVYLWNTNPTQNTQTATGLVPGNYAVCVTDANGCTGCVNFLIGNSACNNRDFEDGDFSNFTGESGNNANGGGGNISWTGGLIQGPNDAPASSTDQHTIITINTLDTLAIDPTTGQPDVFMTTLAPNGGNFSVRLGNANNGFGAEGLKISFTGVTTNDTVFTYQFAGVYEDPGHLLIEQPGFMVNVYDANGQKDATLSQTIYAMDPAYPFIVSTNMGPNGSPIVYRRWQGLSINLSAYVGQAVTLEFANFDCAYGGHMGYTYLDGSCFGSLIANVWPGDCDYDLNANNVDLLSLGLAYGATGTARSGASNNWIAQSSADWAQSFTLGANYKHSDCNGDGVVNADDTLAISLNYGSTHPFKIQQPVYNNALPDMYLVTTADSIGPNSLVNVDILLGKNTMPVDSIYAIAFSITYDPTYLNAFNTGANFSTSWLGVIGSNMISLQKNLFSSGKIDLALTRSNHSNAFGGNGKIGTFTFRTTPVTSVNPGNIPLMITGVKAITATGRVISLNAIGEDVYFDPAMLGIPSYLNADLISVFPNPADKEFTITLPSGIENVSVELLNLLGQNAMTVKNVKQNLKLDVSSLPAGMYQMKISCDVGVAMKKIQVIRK
ncbi:MAG: T9SS type A sorting domain-containing protein [Bacteroidetes bacterium]|nr:MAG: T9SS type A sorting domain-containing protein [Bacteroidota bacterium]